MRQRRALVTQGRVATGGMEVKVIREAVAAVLVEPQTFIRERKLGHCPSPSVHKREIREPFSAIILAITRVLTGVIFGTQLVLYVS